MRKPSAPYARRSGRGLSRLLWRLLNRGRPVAGWPVTYLRGSPIKGTLDHA